MTDRTTNPTEVDPVGEGAIAGEARGARRPRIDGAEGARRMAAARRSYALAELMQERRSIGSVDSAVAAHRAFTQLFELLLRLHGEEPPRDFPELAERARAIAAEQSLLADELSADVALIDAMRRRVVEGGGDVPGPEDRRYDRAFVRAGGWLDGVASYLDELFPAPAKRLPRGAAFAVGGALLFVAGVFIGAHMYPGSPGPTAAGPLTSRANPAGAAATLNAPLPASRLLIPARLLLTDEHVACSGCWPLEGSLEAPYAWTAGRAEFVVKGLPVARAFRVSLGVLDPGHVEAVHFQTPTGEPSEATKVLDGILVSPLPVTSGEDGTLRWSVGLVPWKPSDFVKGSNDGRELGIAVTDVRIEDASAQIAQGAPSASANR